MREEHAGREANLGGSRLSVINKLTSLNRP